MTTPVEPTEPLRLAIYAHLSATDFETGWSSNLAELRGSVQATLHELVGDDGGAYGVRVLGVEIDEDEPLALTREGRVAAAVALAKKEIVDLIEADLIPSDVASFSVLHDYCDANVLGGLCDGNLPYDGEELMEFGNDVQHAVDAWLRAGRR